MGFSRRPWSWAFVAVLSGACTLQAPVANAARHDGPTLRVFAAASLADALGDLAGAFEKAHPGTTVLLNLAGSQQLATQMEQGATADVFASADQRWMDSAREHGLVAGNPRLFARNVLVVIVPRTNPGRIGRLQDLSRRGIKLVIGAEAVPVGAYSRQMLANLTHQPGFGADFARRVLANVVSEEENVKSVLGKVQLGEADAGIVYRSDVTPAMARFVRRFDVPEAANVIAAYPIAVAANAPHGELAHAFVDLVLSPAGQQTLVRHGLIPAAVNAP
jgi:molybdate transport system substrate-binding protein